MSALMAQHKLEEWPTRVDAAAKLLGIDVKGQAPGWLLVSMWC